MKALDELKNSAILAASTSRRTLSTTVVVVASQVYITISDGTIKYIAWYDSPVPTIRLDCPASHWPLGKLATDWTWLDIEWIAG